MLSVKTVFRFLITVLIVISLPAAPFFDLVTATARTAENCCGPVCTCCGDESDKTPDDGNLNMTAKCTCNMDDGESAKEIPPLTASSLSNDNNSTFPFNEIFFYKVDLNNQNFILKTAIITDDTGPPLYLVHASFLI
ncbi:MAG: hypothetical protein JXA92_11890 [candidate division Zixibacteria bacterium]|nr:hypothetical protein [candidate division Zixibacteria bacterium]